MSQLKRYPLRRVLLYRHDMYVHVYMCTCSYLHGNREVSLSLRREVDINSFLGEGLVALGW